MLLLIAACSTTHEARRDAPAFPESADPVAAGPVVDEFQQAEPSTVDVLIVVDPALAADLAGQLPALVGALGGADWRIGLVSSSVADPATAGVVTLFEPGDTIPPLTDGEPHDPLYALYLALEPGTNPAFPSADRVHLVIVSAEEPGGAGLTAPEVIDLWESAWPDAQVSVIAPEGSPLEAIADGVRGDLAEPWEEPLAAIGVSAVGIETELFLTERPVVETLRVAVHHQGASWTFEPPEWVYNADRNAIQLVEFIPNPGALIRVSYTADQ